MLKSQLNFLCEKLGSPDLGPNEKWKSIKYIFIENPIVDVQRLLKNREIMYIDNPDIGPGFYIIGYTNSDLGIPKYDRVVTFIPLKLIDKISIITKIDVENDGTTDEENNIIYVDSEGDTLILGNIEVDTYEDIIIINNVTVKPDGDTLVIDAIK